MILLPYYEVVICFALAYLIIRSMAVPCYFNHRMVINSEASKNIASNPNIFRCIDFIHQFLDPF